MVSARVMKNHSFLKVVMKAMDSIMGFCQKKVKVVKIVEKESRKYFSLAKTQLFLIDNF